ncbi:MAG: tail fiber domain-containing protein [Bacteroidia bacterium]
MKKHFYQLGKQVLSLSVVIASTLLFSNQVSAQGVSINATGTGTAPDPSSILDLNVANKGFLVPRVALTGTTDGTTILLPQTALMVYNTATGGGVSPGFYYNSGTTGAPTWVSIGGSGSAPTQGLDTDVSGTQVDIEPILNYVHTVSSDMGTGADQPLTLIAPAFQDLIFHSGGAEAGRFLSSGNFGVGDASPLALFTVGSGDLFRVNSSGDLVRINNVPYTWPSANATANGQVLSSTTAGALTWNDPGSLLTAGAGISITGNTIANTGVLSFNASGTGLTPNSATTGAITLAGTLDVDNGGTGAVTLTGMLKGNGTSPVTGVTGTQWGATYWSDANTIAATAAGTTGQLLRATSGGAPTWSNDIPASDADYIWNQISAAQTAPSNFWISNIGKIDGSLQLKGSGANYTTITSAATGNYNLILPVDDGNANQVLATNGTGTLSWATPMTNPMDQWGDIIFGSDASNPSTPDDLSPGTAGLVLHTNGVGANPTWAKVDLAAGPGTEVTGILPVVNGGTGVATIPSNGIMLGAGTSPVTTLVGTNMQTIRNNAGVWSANNTILNDGTHVGIGLTTGDLTASSPYLDVIGSGNTSTSVSLQLRSGNSQIGTPDAVQVAFGFNGANTYRHNIRSVHNSGGNSNNSLNFYVWNPLTDAPGDMGSKKVIEMDYLKLAFYGSLEPNGLPGTAGQVLASGGSGVSPTWVNASTGTVTNVTGTSPINVATGTTTPVISLQGAAGTIAYGTGGGSAFSAAGTVAGQILQSNITGAPTWSTASYPVSTAINTLLYSSAANTVTALPTANSSVLTTNGSGVPTWSTVASMNADLTVQNGLYLSSGTTYDGSTAVTIKQGGALTETTTITQAGFDLIHNLSTTGDFIVQDASVTAFIVDAATGNVGIGNIGTPTHKLQVSGKVKSDGINETSDARLKKNVNAIEGALHKVMEMHGVTYNWKTEEYPERNFDKTLQFGLIAQELEMVIPELVDTDNEGWKSIEYSHIVPVLIEAIKEQQKIIDGQNSTITDLKASLENVLNRVNVIEKNADLNSSKVEK